MKIIFTTNEIKYSDVILKYEDLKGENANHLLIKLLSYCVINEQDITFEYEGECSPFGKKLKEILENEFLTNNTND